MVASPNSRSARLHRFARRLRPIPTALPYYLHTPRGPAERAPGWYMVPGSGIDHPIYLGADAYEAETMIRDMLAAVPR